MTDNIIATTQGIVSSRNKYRNHVRYKYHVINMKSHDILTLLLLLAIIIIIIIIIITSTSDLQPSTAIANQLPGQ